MSAPDRRRGPLAGLLAGSAVSLSGNMLTLIALPLYVLAETGSTTLTGVTGFFATLPVVIGGPFGGVLVDRFGYRRSSVVADLVSAVTIGAVPLLDRTVGLPFWALLTLVFLSGLLDTPGQTARYSLVSDVAVAAHVPLERAVGTFEATERGARLVGAPLAGALYVAIGPLAVLAVDSVTFVVSAALVGFCVPRRLERDAAAAAATATAEAARPLQAPAAQGYWGQLADGFRFAVREPLLRAVVLLVVVTNFFDAAKTDVLLPVYANRELGGAVAFGLLVGTMGGGALVGSLLFGAVGHRLPRRPTFVVSFTLAGAPPYVALALGPPLPGLLAVTALAGLSAGAINPILSTIQFERVPAGMRARVFGLVNAGCWAAVPLGAVTAGFAVDSLGMTATLITIGAAYLFTTLTPLLGGPWGGLDRPTVAAEPISDGEYRPSP